MIAGEVEDYKAQLEQLERNYKQQANELSETNDRVNELSAQNSSLNAHKKRLETTVQQMQSDLDSQVRNTFSHGLCFPMGAGNYRHTQKTYSLFVRE